MVDASDSIVIDRLVEEVFVYVTNVVNVPAWHTDVLEARQASDGPIGVGTVWHARFKPSMGISEGLAAELAKWDDPAVAVTRMPVHEGGFTRTSVR